MNILADSLIVDARVVGKKVNIKKFFGKSLLLTGASGLLGNYFLAVLANQQHSLGPKIKILAVMRSRPPAFVRDLLSRCKAKLFLGDLTDHNFCKKLPKADFVIHAAGYGQPGRFLEDPIRTIKINTQTTVDLIGKLKKRGRFLFVSSSEIYSGLGRPPYKESQIGMTSPDHPRACYIEAKRCGEAICSVYRSEGLAIKVVRLALAYGPGTRRGDQRVLNNFIEKGLHGKITLLDRGDATRTYCYVADAAEIMLRVLLDGKDHVYNVGGDSRITIAQLAMIIGDYLKVPVVFPKQTKKLSGAPSDVYLDTAKVRKEFKKNRYVPLNEGLIRTIEWQKKLYEVKR